MARLQASSSSPSATLRALVLCSILLFYQVLAYSRRPAIKRQHAVDKRTKQAHGGTTSLSVSTTESPHASHRCDFLLKDADVHHTLVYIYYM